MNTSQCSWGNKTNHENQSREKLQNQNKKITLNKSLRKESKAVKPQSYIFLNACQRRPKKKRRRIKKSDRWRTPSVDVQKYNRLRSHKRGTLAQGWTVVYCSASKMKKRFSPSSGCSTTLFETFVYGGCHVTQGREGRVKWHSVVKYFPDAFADNILDSGTLSFSGRTRAHRIAGPKRFYFTICNRWGPSYERCICLKRCTYAHHLCCLLHKLMFYTSFFYGNHQNDTNIL